MIHRISLIQTYGPPYAFYILAVLLNIRRQLGVLFQLEIVFLNQRFILLQDKRQAQNIAARGSSVTMGDSCLLSS